MFPVSDVIPSPTRPVVTIALILVISGAFALQLQLDDASLERLVDRYGVSADAVSAGRLVVGLFLHAGWIHVVVNVWYLWLFGPNVERAFGRVRFLVFYIGAGVLATLVQVLGPAFSAPLIGASGAVAAVLGAYFVLYPQSRLLTLFFTILHLDLIEIPAVAFVGMWFVLQLATEIGMLDMPVTVGARAFWSHVSGFAIGIACGAYARWRAGVLRGYWGG
jgi:membrane associated rhomboid family serine protease